MEFYNGEVMELTTNVISEQMYAHCEEDGNDILLLNYFVDYRKTERALLLQDKKLTVNGRPWIKRLMFRMGHMCPLEGRDHYLGEAIEFEGLQPVEVEEY